MRFGVFVAFVAIVALSFSYLAAGPFSALLCLISIVCVVVLLGMLVGLYTHEIYFVHRFTDRQVICRGAVSILTLALGSFLMRYGHDVSGTLIIITIWLLLIVEK